MKKEIAKKKRGGKREIWVTTRNGSIPLKVCRKKVGRRGKLLTGEKTNSGEKKIRESCVSRG